MFENGGYLKQPFVWFLDPRGSRDVILRTSEVVVFVVIKQ